MAARVGVFFKYNMTHPSKNDLESLVDKLFSSKFLIFLAICYFVVCYVSEFISGGKIIVSFVKDVYIEYVATENSSDESLVKNTDKLAADIFEFLRIRRKGEPSFDSNEFQESSHKIGIYYSESMFLYKRDFQSRISEIRQEFLKRGMSNKSVDKWYDNSVNSIGQTEIAQGLNQLSAELKVRLNNSTTTVSNIKGI